MKSNTLIIILIISILFHHNDCSEKNLSLGARIHIFMLKLIGNYEVLTTEPISYNSGTTEDPYFARLRLRPTTTAKPTTNSYDSSYEQKEREAFVDTLLKIKHSFDAVDKMTSDYSNIKINSEKDFDRLYKELVIDIKEQS